MCVCVCVGMCVCLVLSVPRLAADRIPGETNKKGKSALLCCRHELFFSSLSAKLVLSLAHHIAAARLVTIHNADASGRAV